MGFNPKDAVESVRDIATNAVERSADIVESAGHIIKGDVSGGVSGIVQSSIDIAPIRPRRSRRSSPAATTTNRPNRNQRAAHPQVARSPSSTNPR